MNRRRRIPEDIFANIPFAAVSGKGSPAEHRKHTGTIDAIFTSIAFAEAGERNFAGEIMSNRPGNNQHPPAPGAPMIRAVSARGSV
ncbi:MAG: hypothetical protein FIA94_10285 [Nitrospirae bacterium]|nr:hypothetical protein [Nitrospirota bacterium]